MIAMRIRNAINVRDSKIMHIAHGTVINATVDTVPNPENTIALNELCMNNVIQKSQKVVANSSSCIDINISYAVFLDKCIK